jgi:L-fuculose-phosphate aldolase
VRLIISEASVHGRHSVTRNFRIPRNRAERRGRAPHAARGALKRQQRQRLSQQWSALCRPIPPPTCAGPSSRPAANECHGVNQGTVGNVSARTAEGFLISPTGVPYDRLGPEQVVTMDLDGNWAGDWRPSSEWRIHAAIYGTRPEAGAVIHTHAPHATALSCLRRDIPAFHYMMAVTGGASLRCAEYATYGTPELAANMLRALEDRTACLLANHGAVGFAPSLDAARALMAEVENLCRQYILACQAGTPVILDDAEMKRVLEIFKAYGRQDAPHPSEHPTRFPSPR